MAIDQGLWKSIDSESKQFILLLKMESKYPSKHPAVDKLRWKIPLAVKSKKEKYKPSRDKWLRMK